MSDFDMVPFFAVRSLDASIEFYSDGLGFELVDEWVVEGRRRWCQLTLRGASLMLQEFDEPPPREPAPGIRLCIDCDDSLAIHARLVERGIPVREPFVGNRCWVTSVEDPDGYRLDFQSETDVDEETRLSEVGNT